MATEIPDPNRLCFLCGETLDSGEPLNEEHIIPSWILGRFSKNGQFATTHGLQRVRQRLGSHKLRVHKACNDLFDRLLERPMSRDRYTPELLWIWCLKIIVGLRFYEFGHDLDRTQPGKSQNQTLWDYEQDLEAFWHLSEQLLSGGAFQNTPVFSIIELDYLFDDPDFYYTLHHESGVFWLALQERAYLIFFNRLLSDEQLAEYQDLWIKIRDRDNQSHSPQFVYNMYCARVAAHQYFSSASRSFGFARGVWEPVHPEYSEELEDELYAFFRLQVTRKNGAITEWYTITEE